MLEPILRTVGSQGRSSLCVPVLGIGEVYVSSLAVALVRRMDEKGAKNIPGVQLGSLWW